MDSSCLWDEGWVHMYIYVCVCVYLNPYTAKNASLHPDSLNDTSLHTE